MVYEFRRKALDITSKLAISAIHSDESVPFIEYHKRFDNYGSYHKMIWSFNKWSFDSFYPNIEDKIKEEHYEW